MSNGRKMRTLYGFGLIVLLTLAALPGRFVVGQDVPAAEPTVTSAAETPAATDAVTTETPAAETAAAEAAATDAATDAVTTETAETADIEAPATENPDLDLSAVGTETKKT